MLGRLCLHRFLRREPLPLRRLIGTNSTLNSSTETQTSSFEDFIDELSTKNHPDKAGQSFPQLLRNSKLMQLGNFDGCLVVGKIVHRVTDDLYIDVGLKFNAVCKAPALNGELYTIGSRVLLRLHDYELSERFLGSKKDLTLLEADGTLLRLLQTGKKPQGEVVAKKETTEEATTI
ncbi:unnamed protein product, partial [Mesorhabditis belari]|uniref:Mitochondrial ribosomal protein S28 n=1 Tax=Mesorhabditis belari TaxID=2138241 RepID=A0AAF3FFG6_9BILA